MLFIQENLWKRVFRLWCSAYCRAWKTLRSRPTALEFSFFFSLLLALGNPKVNYFSLDIEGAELQVLRSVPWHLVDIEVLEESHLWNFLCLFNAEIISYKLRFYHHDYIFFGLDPISGEGYFCWDPASGESVSRLSVWGEKLFLEYIAPINLVQSLPIYHFPLAATWVPSGSKLHICWNFGRWFYVINKTYLMWCILGALVCQMAWIFIHLKIF